MSSIDPESSVLGGIVVALVAIIGKVVHSLLRTAQPADRHQQQLRDDLRRDMDLLLRPMKEDISELKAARLGERVAALEAHYRDDRQRS